jgi:hypothetical protein
MRPFGFALGSGLLALGCLVAIEMKTAPKKSRLWLWFVAAFIVQLGAWTAWFAIAAKHKVAEVPLSTAVGYKR